MGDRLTQIQDCLDKVTEMLYISVGMLQRDAPLISLNPEIPITAWTEEQVAKNQADTKAFATEFSTDIVQTCKVIDYLIDRLPGINFTEEEQLQRLKDLEQDNVKAGEELEAMILKAESVLSEIKSTIRHIADDQFEFHRKQLSS
ncbi:Mediator of RNA polymerase II transcription subunit 21 [Blyttiomyces sp. JEL0837]|nr:Mediator of RNA polymerase II transcription subunit 21 [Blyttiomyces sp. JEL0837]